MDAMIRQVALLTKMMKKVQKNRARSEVNEKREGAEGVREPEGGELSNAEEKIEALPEKQMEEETVEIESDEKETLAKEESITTPPDDKALKEILKEAVDEPQKKEKEVIECGAEIDNTLFYFHSEEVHVPYEKVGEFSTAVKGENAPAERPLPKIDDPDECCYEKERPKQKGAGAVEAEPAEEESQAKEGSSITPLVDDLTRETPEEADDEYKREKERDFIRCKELGASLFHLQTRTEQAFEEREERFVPKVEEEHARPKKLPPMISKTNWYYNEEEPELKGGRRKRRAARFIYWCSYSHGLHRSR